MMKKKEKQENQIPKGCSIAVGIIIVVSFLIIGVKFIGWAKSPSTSGKIDYSQEWSQMTYEDRSNFLDNAITNKSFFNATEAENVMRDAIKQEVLNPKTVSYVWRPDIYNGGAVVVEADSGWISVPFKLNAKNDFGIEKEIMGSVMYIYIPATNSLDIMKWDISQNE